MRKIFLLTILIFALSFQNALAKQELIEASGSYVMDLKVDETFATGTARAREEAKRAATEKAGVYLQSYSKMINLELDYDEVKTVAAALLQIQGEKISSNNLAGGLIEITVTIQALVEVSDDDTLKNMMTDRNSLEAATERYKNLQAEYDALKKQMDELKKNYNAANAAQIKAAVAQNNKYFEAFLALEQGNNFYFNHNFQQAISDYSRALEINPNFAEAYNNRGNAHVLTKNFQQAISDYQNALRLNKIDARIYNNLGNIYLLQKNYDAAIAEYSQALNLNPNLFTAYYNRALAYCYKNDFQSALPDAQRAKDLNPADTDAQNLYSQIRSRLN